MEKICRKCKKVKNNFWKRSTSKDGYNTICADCVNDRRNHLYKENKETKRQKYKVYYANNCEQRKKALERVYKWRKENKEKHLENRRIEDNFKRRSNPNYRIKYALRARLRHALKGNFKTGSAVKDLGCTIEEFKIYLESKFLPGMNWDNHGDWHIDHIKPLSKFDLTIREQFLEACHYTNLQPLWAIDNIKKSNKI